MKKQAAKKDFIDEIEAMLPLERVMQRAKKKADKEIFRIKLSELRIKMA